MNDLMEELQTYYQIPSIAHFCNLFRHSLDLPDFDYEDLEFAFLSDITTTDSELGSTQSTPCHLILRLICTLLKGYFNININHTNWEKYLQKVFQIQWIDIEKKRSPFVTFDERGEEIILSFNDLPLRSKVNVVHCLCDYRLFADDISHLISEINAEDYRVEPLGTDTKGYIYWYFYGTRLYRENPSVAQSIETNYKNFDDLVHKRAEDIKRNIELSKLREEQELKKQTILENKRKKDEERRKSLATKALGSRTGLRQRKTDQTVPNGVCLTTSIDSKNSSSVESNKKIESSAKELKELTVSSKQRSDAWSLVCRTEQDWNDLCLKFEKSKTKCELEFYKLLSQSFVPKIHEIFENQVKDRERLERQKLLELLPRRLSSRIEIKKLQKEKEELEEEFKSQRQQEESERRNSETDRQRSERIKQEREVRAQKRLQLVEERAERALKRERIDLGSDSQSFDQNMETNESNIDYITEDFINEIPNPLTNTFESFYEGLEKVINAVKSNRDAWPFAEAVDGVKFPMYYQVIEEPIDLSIIERKIENRNYDNFEELENDFKLMVNNCETFNGPKNGYTLMAYGVWRAFKRSALKHMQRELSYDERTAFIYPQKVSNTNVKPAIEAKKKKMRNKRSSTFTALDVLAEAAEKAVEANIVRLKRNTSSTASSLGTSSPISIISNDSNPSTDGLTKLNSCRIHGDMLANFLFNANHNNTVHNSIPIPDNTTTQENLTFKSLDEWSESIKKSGNCVVLPQNAVIITSPPFTPCTNWPVIRPSVSVKVVSTGNTSNSVTTSVNTINSSNLFTSSVISNNENASKELVNSDPKRLVIKLSRCESSGQVWRPVTLITSSPQKSFNTISINSNQTNGKPITSSVQQFQGFRNIATNGIPVNKRFVIQDINNKSNAEHNSGLNLNANNSPTVHHSIPQSFQITGIQKNSNLKVFRLKKLDQNLNQNQISNTFQTNSLSTNQSPVIPKVLLMPLDKQTSKGNGLSSGL